MYNGTCDASFDGGLHHQRVEAAQEYTGVGEGLFEKKKVLGKKKIHQQFVPLYLITGTTIAYLITGLA